MAEWSSQEEEDNAKLFVGQIPKHITESQLLAVFQEFSLVDEVVTIIKDKATRASRGCCFVVCPSRKEANKPGSRLSCDIIRSMSQKGRRRIRRSMLAITRKLFLGFRGMHEHLYWKHKQKKHSRPRLLIRCK